MIERNNRAETRVLLTALIGLVLLVILSVRIAVTDIADAQDRGRNGAVALSSAAMDTTAATAVD